MLKVAVIITGDVRDCNAKYNIIRYFKDFDVFCGSYKKHEEYIKTIGRNNKSILIDPSKDIRLPKNISNENIQQNMLQWLHLDNIINHFKSELLTYDIILKFRFDCVIINGNLNFSTIENNIVYNQSDQIFYSNSKTFIDTFNDFYDNIFQTCCFLDFNDFSFEKSWKSELVFANNLKNKNIINNKQMIFAVRIDRGNYNKVTADGNKPLYVNNTINGKFT